MKYIEEYRQKELVCALATEIAAKLDRPITLMEVCGTHTMAIHRHGLLDILPQGLRLLSGPGCPVCVTPTSFVEAAIDLSRRPDVMIATFGDLVRVPGSYSSLEKRKAEGADIITVYSPLDALSLAQEYHYRQVAFLGIGFETTAPTIGVSIGEARKRNIRNFSVLAGNRLVPPALRALLQNKDVKIDGFICPGHVSTIIGTRAYEPIVTEFGVPCVIAGFEPADILGAILLLVEMVVSGKPAVRNAYPRAVTEDGNPIALELMNQVFRVEDSTWRGLGTIPSSGLGLAYSCRDFDARERFDLIMQESRLESECQCGDVLRGAIEPRECPLFAGQCTPEHPVGPCMVSSEGTCAAHFKYRRR